ncbi:MAG: RnfABCDGE type electron transport complex subunit A [Kiritimatiellales bacterium]|nr:RnfABCDGE type electron transport complex subunit A [Kiritimatiellota bacterium]MBL7012331.1 RnfABCDGE type electron transport complex subunit A [Kiritimatiellales bacterium]
MTDNILTITIGAILVNNFVLAKFLGICPFLGVSKKIKTALGMSGAVVFVMTLSSLVTSVIYKYILSKTFTVAGTEINLTFLKILVFIVVIAALVQLVEIILQKFSPPLYQALGIFLPLITTNCAVLGAAELSVQAGRGVLESTIFGFCSALGFALALILFSSLREKLDLAQVPKPLQGTAIGLITAGILAMVFMGFSGLV